MTAPRAIVAAVLLGLALYWLIDRHITARLMQYDRAQPAYGRLVDTLDHNTAVANHEQRIVTLEARKVCP